MKNKRVIKIISIVLIILLICLLITYLKNDSKVVLATTKAVKEFNTENLKDNEHMHLEVDSSGDKVPVPNGYVGSKVVGENEIDTGYVIYEGTEEVNNKNVEEAQKTRNQYVWIPVPDVSKMYGIDENDRLLGKLYNFTINTGKNVDEVTGAKPSWNENNGLINGGDYEPKVAPKNANTVYDMNSRLKSFELKEVTTHEFLFKLEQEFNNTIKSIETYGGFYIGRYETGDLSKDKLVVTKENNDIGGQTWYEVYKKCGTLKNENTNIETGLIWGSQWDRTIMWLVESNNKTKEEICINSTSWGNYSAAEFEYKNSNGEIVIKEAKKSVKIPTGSTEYTKANNIYDLAGNVREWTMECNGINAKTFRGGYYYNGIDPVSERVLHTPNFSNNAYGCRAMLYIK